MARLPSRETLGPLPQIRGRGRIATVTLPRGNPAGIGAVALGRGVAAIGQAAEAIQDRERQREAFETEGRYQQFAFDKKIEADQSANAVQPGQARGFPGQAIGQYEEAAKEFLTTVPEHVRPLYEEKLARTGREIFGSAVGFAQKAQSQFARNNVINTEETVLRPRARMASGPEELEEVAADHSRLIRGNPDIPGIEGAEMERRGRRAIGISFLDGTTPERFQSLYDARMRGEPPASGVLRDLHDDDWQRAAAVQDRNVRARIIDEEKQLRLRRQQAQQESEAAENEHLTNIYSDAPTTAREIVNDNRLSVSAKERLARIANTANKPEAPAAVSRSTTVGLLDDMRRPDGDPQKITDLNPIYDAYIGERLTRTDFEFLRKEFAQRRTPDGQNFEKRKDDFLKAITPALDKSNPLMGKIDESGREAVYRYTWELNQRIDEYRKEGKNPYDLLDPSKADYMGAPERLSPFQKTLQQSLQDQARKFTPQPGAGAAVQRRQPGESIESYLARTGAR